MIFTSYTYLAFLALTFLLHWTLPGSWRTPFLIVASYCFYMSWRWEFGFLLLTVSLFNWAYARWVLARHPRGQWLALGIVANLAPLVWFKYAGFLAANVAAAARVLGGAWEVALPDIVLPLGISFFTFQGIAYLVDVAGGEQPLVRLREFLLFKALWPQLIAGPIVRLHEVRVALLGERTLDYADYSEGCRRILWGFFKKVVLADSLSSTVEMVFLHSSPPHAVDCVTGILAFGLQIYFDFSAYSDIAIGSARLFGFRFPENFDWPYLSASPVEFWSRWHSTLSRWIRDYLFTPLAFASRRSPRLEPVWLLVAMALCGLWHGAAWTFVAWGLLHGILLALNRSILKPFFPDPLTPEGVYGRGRRWLGIFLTFILVHAGWLVFRATSLEQVGRMAWSVLTLHGGLRFSVLRENHGILVSIFLGGLLLAQGLRGHWAVLVLWAQAHPTLARMSRPVLYSAMILAVVVFDQEAHAFVYFQF